MGKKNNLENYLSIRKGLLFFLTAWCGASFYFFPAGDIPYIAALLAVSWLIQLGARDLKIPLKYIFAHDIAVYNLALFLYGVTGNVWSLLNILFIYLAGVYFDVLNILKIAAVVTAYYFLILLLEIKGIAPVFDLKSSGGYVSDYTAGVMLVFWFTSLAFYYGRRASERKLKFREEIFKASGLLIIFDSEGNITGFSEAMKDFLGYGDLREKKINEIFRQKSGAPGCGVFLSSAGEEIPVNVRKSRFRNSGGIFEAEMWDVADLRGSEEIIMERDRFRHIVSQMGDALVIFGKNGEVTYSNEKADEIFDHATGKNCGEILGGECTDENFERAFEKKEIFSRMIETENRKFIVTFSPVSLEGETHCLGILKDMTAFYRTQKELRDKITELNSQRAAMFNLLEDLQNRNRQLEELKQRLIQQEKLAGIGKLSAGVAHELNNPLTTVMTLNDLLFFTLKDRLGEKERRNIELIKDAAGRMKKIIEDLLVFSRSGKSGEKKPVNFNEIIEKTQRLVASDIKGLGVKVVKKLGDIPEISGDGNKLMEVFINLFTNSLDALDKKDKEIRVETFFDGKNKEIMVKYRDNGRGMDSETAKNIFDPFFTTKEKGTGLGMSITYGIIKDHRGDIRVESAKGEYTEFVMRFPVK